MLARWWPVRCRHMTPPWTHPETAQGELFLSNMTAGEFEAFEWSSKRMGRVAYDGEGRRLDVSDWLPVFIRNSELVERAVTITVIRRQLRERHEQAA